MNRYKDVIFVWLPLEKMSAATVFHQKEMEMSSEVLNQPAIGEEVPVIITPSVRSDRKWMQFGNLLSLRQDDESGLRCGRIQVTRQLTTEENPCSWNSDDTWKGTELDAVHNPYSNDWRAVRPACSLAKSVWERCWSEDNRN